MYGIMDIIWMQQGSEKLVSGEQGGFTVAEDVQIRCSCKAADGESL